MNNSHEDQDKPRHAMVSLTSAFYSHLGLDAPASGFFSRSFHSSLTQFKEAVRRGK